MPLDTTARVTHTLQILNKLSSLLMRLHWPFLAHLGTDTIRHNHAPLCRHSPQSQIVDRSVSGPHDPQMAHETASQLRRGAHISHPRVAANHTLAICFGQRTMPLPQRMENAGDLHSCLFKTSAAQRRHCYRMKESWPLETLWTEHSWLHILTEAKSDQITRAEETLS
jgi:hypothetical protein